MKPAPAATGKTRKKGEGRESGTAGGTVVIYCGNWTSATSLTVDVAGGKGGKGGVGGNGGDGKTGSKSSNGSCKVGVFKCCGKEGTQGAPSGNGGCGGNGVNGGQGGSGGSVSVVNSKLLTTNIILSGAGGGTGGTPGNGGKGGPTFPAFKKVTKCRCSKGVCTKCKYTTTTYPVQTTRDGSSGLRGASGKSGATGTFLSVDKPALLPKTHAPEKNVLVWLRLLRRYVSDRLLSVEGLEPDSARTQEVVTSGLKVLDTVRDGADLLSNDFVESQKQITDVLRTRLRTGQVISDALCCSVLHRTISKKS